MESDLDADDENEDIKIGGDEKGESEQKAKKQKTVAARPSNWTT